LLTPVNNLTLVSWTPVNNLTMVTLTLAITFFSGVVDTGQKQPKSLKFIARPPENCSRVSMIPPMNKDKLDSPVNISLPTPENEK
jgi:hypothetical protein